MMGSYCACCGSPVPEGQSVCSMCYGDVNYGRDEYYRNWLENAERNPNTNIDLNEELERTEKP